MCAIDALAIPQMADRDATPTAADPSTAVAVTVEARDRRWLRTPAGTVVLVAQTGRAGGAPQCSCGYVNCRSHAGRLRAWSITSASPGMLPTAAVAMIVCGHGVLAATPASAYSAAQPRVSSSHGVFRRRVGRIGAEPFGGQVEWRRPRQDVRVGELRRCGSAARVNRNVPRNWICCIRSNRLIGSSSVCWTNSALALLTQMPMPPNRSTACRTACRPTPFGEGEGRGAVSASWRCWRRCQTGRWWRWAGTCRRRP
jgi:hypothetical protein